MVTEADSHLFYNQKTCILCWNDTRNKYIVSLNSVDLHYNISIPVKKCTDRGKQYDNNKQTPVNRLTFCGLMQNQVNGFFKANNPATFTTKPAYVYNVSSPRKRRSRASDARTSRRLVLLCFCCVATGFRGNP